MKFFLNIFPAICFFATYKLCTENSLVYATIAIVVSSIIAFALSFALYKSVTRMQVVIFIILLIFALPTIYFNDPAIIKWKVSMVNIVMALALGACQFVFKTDVARALTGIHNPIPMHLWKNLTISAMSFLFGCAILNYILAFCLPSIHNSISAEEAENIWVNYKTYGNGILNFIFILFAFKYTYSKLTIEQKKELELLMTSMKNKNIMQNNDKKE